MSFSLTQMILISAGYLLVYACIALSTMLGFGSAAGEAVSRRIGDYADKMMKEAAADGDKAGVDAWKEGGANRALMQGAARRW